MDRSAFVQSKLARPFDRILGGSQFDRRSTHHVIRLIRGEVGQDWKQSFIKINPLAIKVMRAKHPAPCAVRSAGLAMIE
ncbi:hypothetical protein C0995_011173 [Termitomyces sp. Mi166|nr:hypothetical protein C0995_011173 [Termitomyces sp. Mi166\